LIRKIWLYKPPCKKIFFLRFAQFFQNIVLKVTLGQIFWLNSSSAMVLKYIKGKKNLKQCFMLNVSSVAILVGQLLFLHSLPDKKCESSFA